MEQLGVEAVVKGFGTYVSQIAAMEAATMKAAGSMDTAATRQAAASRRVETAISTMSKVAAASLGVVAVASAKAAIDFESSFAGVRKTVDGTDAELDAIAKAFRNMAKEIPVNVNELNRIGEAAGQLGVEKENIVQFTETIAMLGATTNLVGEQGATSLARFMNIMGTAPDDVDNLASAVVALGNAGASTESEILEMSQRIAGAAVVVGMSEADVLGFANALSSLGIEAEAGGSSFSRVVSDMAKAAADGGKDLEAFARAAGMSADGFARLFAESPAAAVQAFVEGLARISEEGGNVYATLDELSLSEIRVSRMLLAMASNTDLVADSVKLGGEAIQSTSALTEEFGKRVETTASQIQIARNNLNDAAISLGQAFLPAIGQAAQAVSGIASFFTAIPEGTRNLLLLTAAVVALSVPLTTAAARAREFVIAMSAGTLSARANVALLAGSIGLVVTALDSALRATTGKGLWATFWDTGDDADARAAADAIRQIGYELEAIPEGRALDYLSLQMDALAESAAPAAETLREFYDEAQNGDAVPPPENIRETEKAMADLTARATALGAQLAQSGATTADLTKHYQALKSRGLDDLADAFAKGADLNARLNAEQEKTSASARAVQMALEPLGPTLEQLGGVTKSVGDAFSESLEPMGEFEDELDRLEAREENLDRAMERLVGQFGSLNPAVLQAGFNTAFLQEELDDLNRTGETFSTTLGMSKDELQGAIDASAALAETFLSNERALQGMLPLLERYYGEENTGRLLSALRETNVAHETQIDVMRRLGQGLTALSTDNVPSAIGAFQSLKDLLGDGPAWQEIAQNVGPRLVSAIEQGVADPAQKQALLDQVTALVGDAVASGESKAAEASAVGQAFVTAVESVLGPDHPAVAALKTAVAGVVDAMNTAGTTKAAVAEEVGRAVLTAIAAAFGADSPEYQAVLAAVNGVITAAGGAEIQTTANTSGHTLGSEFGEGVSTGISSQTENVRAAALGVAAAAKQAIQGVSGFFTGSPSKWAIEHAGKPFAQGVAVGITSGEQEIVDAVEALAGVATSEMVATLEHWRITLHDNLKGGIAMSEDELKVMLASIVDTIVAAPLPDAFESVMMDALGAMLTSIVQGKGLANAAMIDLIDQVLATLASGAEAVARAASAVGAAAGSGIGAGAGAVMSPSNPGGGGGNPGGSGYVGGVRVGYVYKGSELDALTAGTGSLPGVAGYKWEVQPGGGWMLVEQPGAFTETRTRNGRTEYLWPDGSWRWDRPDGYVEKRTNKTPVGGFTYDTDSGGTTTYTPSEGGEYTNDTGARWVRLPNGNWALVTIPPGGTLEDALAAQGITSYACGTDYLPADTLAMLHKGEAVVPADENPNNPNNKLKLSPWTFLAPLLGGRGGGRNIDIGGFDFRGAVFNGTADENATAIRDEVQAAIAYHLGRGAMLSGIPSRMMR